MTEHKLEELIQKYADGTATEAEVRQLMDWYDSSPVEAVPWLTTNPNEQQQLYDRMLHRLQKEVAPQRSKLIHFSWMKVAAVFIVVIGIAFLALRLLNTSESFVAVANPSGKIQLVQLPDGSKVWLNAASTLKYAKEFKNNRQLQLQGEAYFDVTPDADHPFSIEAGGVETTVLGTAFNIKAYEEDELTEISVVKGRVGVANDSKQLAVLTPQMQLKFERASQKANTIKVDTSSIIAWRKGQLLFDDQTFFDIAETLERWYGIKIKLSNPAIGNCRYYMGFDNNTPLEKLLSTMAEITEMKYVINKNTITISGRPCL